MTDFVLTLGETSTFDVEESTWYYQEVAKLQTIRSYAKFLKQPLTLGMFVPCDEEGNPMLEPGSGPIYTHSEDYMNRYKSAKNRCLFEGFEIRVPKSNFYDLQIISKDQYFSFDRTKKGLWIYDVDTPMYRLTIESILEDLYNISLTPTAIKTIEP